MNEESHPTSTPPLAATSEDRPSPAQEARLEKVRKIYVRDLEQGERVHTVFLVTRKARSVGRSGKTYVALSLSDKTGDVDGRIFDQVEQLEPSFATGDYVLLEGEVISFHGKPQLLVSAIERLDPEPIDRKEFVSHASAPDGKRSALQVRDAVGRVRDPNLKALLQAFFDEPQTIETLDRPVGRPGAHGQRGRFGEQLLSLVKLANRIADHYPMADRDLLVSGALLYDIAALREAKRSDSVDEVRLVGRAVMAAQAIHDKAAQTPNFPQALEHHLAHIVLSCASPPEQVVPRAPMTLEALLLATLIQMDAEVSSWLELMARDPHEKWTEPSRACNRPLWKGVVPTARNKPPVEMKLRRSNGADRKRSSGSAPARAVEAPAQEEPVFKPLSEIAPQALPTEPPEPSQDG